MSLTGTPPADQDDDELARQSAELERAHQALRESEERFRLLADGARDVVYRYRLAPARGFEYVSPSAEAVTGYTPAEYHADPDLGLRIVHPEDRARLEEEVLGDGNKGSLTFRIVHRDGRVLWIEQQIRRVREADGRLLAVEGVARDISARKQMEERLLIADRMASLGTLAGGVAHEINNPLGYVIANLEYVDEELRQIEKELPGRVEELKTVLTEARQGAERVRRIVRDLKTFSRADQEERGPVDVHRVLELSINMTWNEIRHRARLVKDWGVVPPVEASESRLGQVFINLLVNAAQAIPVGAAERHEIRLVTRAGPGAQVLVEVRDSGPGIPTEHLGRIFDPFFTTKPAGVGTGLGLCICHGIVTSLGGTITVESEPGQGTAFRVRLPVAEDRPPPAPVAPPAMAPARRGRVLVVDDEPLIGAALRRALVHEQEVTVVEGARAALGRIQAGERFDVILCDVMMPDMTGMDFHAELTRLAPEMIERIIFVTGGAFAPAAREFLDHSTLPRLEKPIDIPALRALIRTMMR